MKSKIYILSLIFVLFFSCKENDKTDKETLVEVPEEKLSLKGSWVLKGFSETFNLDALNFFIK